MASNLTELRKLSATATFVDIVAPAGLYAGDVYVLGTQASNKTYACAVCGAVTDLGMVVAIPVALPYEASKVEKDYVVATNEVVRAVVPYVGLTIGLAVANITATSALAVGKVVVPNASAAPMECLASIAGTEVLVFEIDALYTLSGVAMASIRCIRA